MREICRVIQILPPHQEQPGPHRRAGQRWQDRHRRGLAQRIVNGDVPEGLKKRIVQLDMGRARGRRAKYRGEFGGAAEGRPQGNHRIRREIILFVDEMHTV